MIKSIYIYKVKINSNYTKYYLLDKETLDFISDNKTIITYVMCTNTVLFTLYISKNIKEYYNLKSFVASTMSTITNNSNNLITFNELLDLVRSVDNNDPRTQETIKILQLIIANWEDWY